MDMSVLGIKWGHETLEVLDALFYVTVYLLLAYLLFIYYLFIYIFIYMYCHGSAVNLDFFIAS